MRRGPHSGCCSPWTGSTGGMGIAHIRISARGIACALAVIASMVVISPASAALPFDANCQAQPQNTCLGDSLNTAADPGKLGSPESPEDDLEAVLTDLGKAPNATAATMARGRALAIIEGDADKLVPGDTYLARKAYAGIPLLNSDETAAAAGKVKVVPGTHEVDVREVRFGDHAILDTSMLQFAAADMGDEFTIHWHITELEASFGGELEPAGVPAAGPAHRAALDSLVVPPVLMGTSVENRFHPL